MGVSSRFRKPYSILLMHVATYRFLLSLLRSNFSWRSPLSCSRHASMYCLLTFANVDKYQFNGLSPLLQQTIRLPNGFRARSYLMALVPEAVSMRNTRMLTLSSSGKEGNRYSTSSLVLFSSGTKWFKIRSTFGIASKEPS